MLVGPGVNVTLASFLFFFAKKCGFSVRIFTHKNYTLSPETHVSWDRVPLRERTFRLFPQTFLLTEPREKNCGRRPKGFETDLASNSLLFQKPLKSPKEGSEKAHPGSPTLTGKSARRGFFAFSLHTKGS